MIFQSFSLRLSPARPATQRDNASSGEPFQGLACFGTRLVNRKPSRAIGRAGYRQHKNHLPAYRPHTQDQ